MPGKSGVLTYQIQNPSNGPDTYDLTTAAAPGTDSGQVTYWEDDGDGAFDPAKDTAFTRLSLQPDEQKTFFATYPVPADASSATSFTFTPVATSAADTQVKDSNNYGRIDTQQVLRVAFTQSETGTATSPGSVTYTHTLRNTGNTPLTAQNLSLTTASGSWTYSYRVGDASAGTDPQAALAAWTGTLAPGESLPVQVTVTAPAGLAGGTQDTLTVSAATLGTSGPAVDNQTLAPITLTDMTTILRGVPGAVKSALSCGHDPTCAAPTAITDNLIAPNEYVQYTVTGTNSGNGGLRRPVLKDTLPQYLKGVSWSGAASGVTGGQVLYSLDGQSWNTAPPSIADSEGQAVYLGFDSNRDGQVTLDDTLAPGASLTLKLTTVVK